MIEEVEGLDGDDGVVALFDLEVFLEAGVYAVVGSASEGVPLDDVVAVGGVVVDIGQGRVDGDAWGGGAGLAGGDGGCSCGEGAGTAAVAVDRGTRGGREGQTGAEMVEAGEGERPYFH